MIMNKTNTLTMDGAAVAIEGERNLLELARKANIDIPTFCYHSDLSVYGACRLCLMEVEGRGVVAGCSTPPEPGLVVRTHTPQIREIRKVAVELLLANHEHACPTCPKSRSCQLQDVARRLGVSEVRFKSPLKARPVDDSTPSLVRDPNKCILCGDCVRMCHDVQSVGAIDFAHRGADVAVGPAFGHRLDDVECVHCGQCARVCPTGSLTPANDIDDVWAFLDDPDKVVVAQIAPAVRVAVGEMFNQPAGAVQTGKIVAALKAVGFDYVYDAAFAADLTVLEEATEFLHRWSAGERLPQFTSCCPAWVKFAEQYYPELLGNLSSCKSPQQMFGSLAKDILPAQLGVKRENLVVVSIMPCTAKKFERTRPEFSANGQSDVDVVLTTQELGKMIEQAGIVFSALPVESLDMPLGFKTGAGIIFGATGGVSEAVLRYAAEKATGTTLDSVEFHAARGEAGIRLATVDLGGR
ncbi:MAG: [FeFe] hydrogenase, group A, partial [Planctomycetota bacterium]|nr:[FeFe] hydrogenase, group A [Planctomycetota bacterium]